MAEDPGLSEREDERLHSIRNGIDCYKEVILSFDGGGVRVISSLLILDALQKRVLEVERFWDRVHDERPLDPSGASRRGHETATSNQSLPPCLYFDYVVGASIGGIPAIMLGRLRMTTRIMLTEFQKFGLAVFGKRQAFRRFLIDRYSNERLHTAILNLLDNHLNDNDEQSRSDRLPLAQPAHLQHECRTAIVSVKRSQDADQAYLFRSYHSHPCERSTLHLNATSRRPLNQGDNSPVWIHQAAKAAVSTPYLFHETEINGIRFVDGGVCFNNPILEAFWEATKSNQHRRPPFQCPSEQKAVGVIISLGSGKSKKWKTSRKSQYAHRAFVNARRTAYDHLSDPDPTHDQMRQQAELLNIPYFRFDVEHDMDKIAMDSWRDDTLDKIKIATRTYLDLDETVKELNRCAEYIVAIRRGREIVSASRDRRGAHMSNGRAPHPSTARGGYNAGNSSRQWDPNSANTRPTHVPPPRSQTLPTGIIHPSWQGQHTSTIQHPQEMLTPPPAIDLPANAVELPDHRQDRLEAADSFVPAMPRAYTMPNIPAPAYRVS